MFKDLRNLIFTVFGLAVNDTESFKQVNVEVKPKDQRDRNFHTPSAHSIFPQTNRIGGLREA